MKGGQRHGAEECRKIFERLSEYLDLELDPELCEKLESHLDDCPPCQVFLDSLRKTVRVVGSLDAPGLPDQLRREIVQAYRNLGGS